MHRKKNKNLLRKFLYSASFCSLLLLAPVVIGAQDTGSDSADTDKSGIKREPWILQQSHQLYTIQLSAFNNETSAIDFITDNSLQRDVALFRANSGGKVWYKAIYRTFTKRKDAVQAKQELSRRIPEQAPWLRRFSDIQQEINGTVHTAVVGSTGDQLVAQELRRGQSAFNQQDYARALQVWLPLAEQGVVEAQYGLGFMYESGWGVRRDYAKAFEWYEHAANLGHAKSQYNLGLLYLNGFGVEKDASKGHYWVQSAAGQKDIRALDFLESNPIDSGQ